MSGKLSRPGLVRELRAANAARDRHERLKMELKKITAELEEASHELGQASIRAAASLENVPGGQVLLDGRLFRLATGGSSVVIEEIEVLDAIDEDNSRGA